MKCWSLITRLLVNFLALLILSGCVSQLMEQQPGLAGDLFREESNRMLPPEIQILADVRRSRYEEMNYVDNANFSTLRSYCYMPEEQFNKLILLRWELLRLENQNEIILEETKELQKKVAERCTRKGLQTLNKNYEMIKQMHDIFMAKSDVLLKETMPYRPWLYHRLIIMKSDRDFNQRCQSL